MKSYCIRIRTKIKVRETVIEVKWKTVFLWNEFILMRMLPKAS